jgi:uncharacterized damage-inducible protein DinB
MTAGEVRTHLRYTGWASQRLLDAALKLDPEQLSRDMHVSHKSVLETLSHIFFADRIWFARVVDPEEAAPPSSLTPDELSTQWLRIQNRWEQWAESLTDADLDRVVHYKSIKGDPYENRLGEILMHVVNHGTLHRGQVMAMLRQHGVAPPPTDLIGYYRHVAAAHG